MIFRIVLGVALLAGDSLLADEPATIRVHAGAVRNRVSRTMTGACLEDVNHEVYGGIYSQMIFGESFQEPPPASLVKHFRAFGGRWIVDKGVVSIDGGDGPNLVADGPAFSAGEVGVDIYLPGKRSGVAGLIVDVQDPNIGPDRFVGYEIALSSEPGFVRLGRHRNNWEHFKDVGCAVPVDRWVEFIVKLEGTRLEVLLDGKLVASHEDRDHPLAAGTVGLRSFGRACRYRNLWIKSEGQTKALPFEAAPSADDGESGIWRSAKQGTATGRYAIDTQEPFVGRQSQRITFENGQGTVAIENRGLNRWGLGLVPGRPYEGVIWLRAEQAAEVVVSLESGDGQRVHDQTRVPVSAGGWQRRPFTLTPRDSDASGRFAVKLDRPGSVRIGYVGLQPGAWGRYHDLPVRKDVADALVAQGLTVLRYGGSMVNAAEYRWKKMIGPRERRPPYAGTWYPYSSNGWGIVECVAFCEAAGFLAIPAVNMDETPQDMADFVEFMNGPADTPWGRRRAADGHPAPYHLRYLELGNEEAVDDAYWRRFRPMAEAIWAKDPQLILIVGDFAYNGRIEDPYNFRGAPRIQSLAAHRKILELAKARGRPVWFDVHVWNNEPRDPMKLGGGIIGLRDFNAALKKICPGADFKVCVFEENANNHTMRRGLAHAHAVNQLERIGDVVPIVCAANCLQPDGQNDNGWDQGLLFLNPTTVWGQPSYYVTKMIARHPLPICVKAEAASPGDALDVTAKLDEGGKVLQLQVVNLEGRELKCRVVLDDFGPLAPAAEVVELSGRLEERNTRAEPTRIIPVDKQWRHQADGLVYTFRAHSFTILRFERAKP